MRAVLFTDPSCPWAYSANPALRVIEWRYRAQIDWSLVMIGLSDDAEAMAEAGFDEVGIARSQVEFRRRFGMPFSIEPKPRLSASGRACRAIIATRIRHPGKEWQALRALQLLHFNTPLLLDEDDHLAEALGTVPGIDAGAVVEAIDSEPVVSAYRADQELSRSAAGRAGELQGKTARHGGRVRYTAPSVRFEHGGLELEAAGFQGPDAYDVLIANLDPGLERHDPPEGPLEALELYPAGLSTREVAAIMARGNDDPDPGRVEVELVGLVGEGRASRVPLGDDSLWLKR